MPLAEALAFLPSGELSEDEARAVGHGSQVAGRGSQGEAIRLVHEGRLVAIARSDGDAVKPYIVFPT